MDILDQVRSDLGRLEDSRRTLQNDLAQLEKKRAELQSALVMQEGGIGYARHLLQTIEESRMESVPEVAEPVGNGVPVGEF